MVLLHRPGGHGNAKEGSYRGTNSAGAGQAEGGEKAAEICRKLGTSEQTFYTWKRKYSGIGLSELRELCQLRDKNAKLKKLVADLSLDRLCVRKKL